MVCAPLAFIDGLGGPEMMLVFVIVLVLFGGQKLPEFARGLGKTMREFKKAASGVEEEFKRALEEDERKKTAVLPAYSATSTPAALNAPADETNPHTYDSDAHAYETQEDHYSDAGPHSPSDESTSPAPEPPPPSNPIGSEVPEVQVPPPVPASTEPAPPTAGEEKKKPVEPGDQASP